MGGAVDLLPGQQDARDRRLELLPLVPRVPRGGRDRAVNQFKYHVGMGADPEGLLSYCKSHGIAAQAYSPLGDDSSELITGKFVTAAGKARAARRSRCAGSGSTAWR